MRRLQRYSRIRTPSFPRRGCRCPCKISTSDLVGDVIERLRGEITIVGDDLYFEKSIEIAVATGSRGADAYYIGLAEMLDAPLATSDKVQAQNARKAGAKAFYVLDKRGLKELIKLLGCKEWLKDQ